MGSGTDRALTTGGPESNGSSVVGPQRTSVREGQHDTGHDGTRRGTESEDRTITVVTYCGSLRGTFCLVRCPWGTGHTRGVGVTRGTEDPNDVTRDTGHTRGAGVVRAPDAPETPASYGHRTPQRHRRHTDTSQPGNTHDGGKSNRGTGDS